MFLEILLSNFLKPLIIYPTRIVKNAKPSLVDNIFTNILNNDLTNGNLIDKISDHLPNFTIIPNYKKTDIKTKYQKRDYSNFSENNFKTAILTETYM